MAERFRVLIVGRSKSAWANAAVADYVQRLKRHGGVREIPVKVENYRGDVEAVQRAEAERLLKQVKPGDVLVVLDERGERLDSHAFAGLVDAGRGRGTVVFALGGAYGHAPELRDRAWRVVRISDLVMNHEVARVVLFEQLYRAMTLVAGIPYHH